MRPPILPPLWPHLRRWAVVPLFLAIVTRTVYLEALGVNCSGLRRLN